VLLEFVLAEIGDGLFQARLEEAIGDFCENKFEKRPSETAIRDNIREPLERWRQSRSET